MRVAANWLVEPGKNPFNLQAPPGSFLRELAAFDADIVIFPSMQRFGYWLTRRRSLTAGISTVLTLDSDSAVMARYGLIPVTLFGGTVTWGPQVLQWLADRDTWRVGGGAKAADLVEQQEQTTDRQAARALDAENDARARSMYRTYKTRAGERVALSDVDRGRQAAGTKHRVLTDTSLVARTGSAPVLPTGWTPTPSGLVTPPTLR